MERGMRNEDNELKEQAVEYFNQAYHSQMQGSLSEAIELYKKSIHLYPTAEAYTFLGWTYSFQGKLHEAIEECHHAIQVDPDFGNPYNDIGSYLVELGKPDEAIAWLEKAKTAKRYEARCFPYFNLGRIYEAKGKWLEALKEYKQALAQNPGYTMAEKAILSLQARMN